MLSPIELVKLHKTGSFSEVLRAKYLVQTGRDPVKEARRLLTYNTIAFGICALGILTATVGGLVGWLIFGHGKEALVSGITLLGLGVISAVCCIFFLETGMLAIFCAHMDYAGRLMKLSFAEMARLAEPDLKKSADTALLSQAELIRQSADLPPFSEKYERMRNDFLWQHHVFSKLGLVENHVAWWNRVFPKIPGGS